MEAGTWGQTRNLGDRTLGPVDVSKRRSEDPGRLRCQDMGTDTMSGIPIRNVQRETFNSQLSTGRPKGRMVGGRWGQTRNLGDRTIDPAGPDQAPVGWSKPALAPRDGDRHAIWTTGLLTRFDPTKGGADGPGRLLRPDMGTDTMSDIPITNVQRPTFNSQLLTG